MLNIRSCIFKNDSWYLPLLADASGSYIHVPLGITCDLKVPLSLCWDWLRSKFKDDSGEVRKIRKHCQWQPEVFLKQRLSLYLKYKFAQLPLARTQLTGPSRNTRGAGKCFSVLKWKHIKKKKKETFIA